MYCSIPSLIDHTYLPLQGPRSHSLRHSILYHTLPSRLSQGRSSHVLYNAALKLSAGLLFCMAAFCIAVLTCSPHAPLFASCCSSNSSGKMGEAWTSMQRSVYQAALQGVHACLGQNALSLSDGSAVFVQPSATDVTQLHYTSGRTGKS